MIEKIIEVLQGSEGLDLNVVAKGNGKYRILVALKPVTLPELSSTEQKEDKDGVSLQAQAIRAKLAQPVVFEGTLDELGSDLDAFIEFSQSEPVSNARQTLQQMSESLTEMVAASKAKAKSATKAKPAAKPTAKTTEEKAEAKPAPKAAETKPEPKPEPEETHQAMLDLLG